MATITKAKAKKNGTYVAPPKQRPAGWLPHFIRVVIERD